MDVAIEDRLRSQGAAHLDVFDVDSGFAVEVFFLGDVEGQGGNR
jgi:hypothetical protein